MKIVKEILTDLKSALTKSLMELTVLGKFLLGPFIVLIFIIIAMSMITIGYPIILCKKRYSVRLRKGIRNILYRGNNF